MLLVQFLAQNCLTLALAPVHLRESDLAQHLSSVLYLEMEIYDSLWKNQCFKQICHGLQYSPLGRLWFLTHSWLLLSKTGKWKCLVFFKGKKTTTVLTGLPKTEYYEKIYLYKNSVGPSYIPQLWLTETLGMFAPFSSAWTTAYQLKLSDYFYSSLSLQNP